MSDINTGTNKIRNKETDSPRHAQRGGRRTGSLTLRILSVNVVAPLILVLGLLYTGQYREGLIRAELETLKVQAQLFSGVIAEGAVRPVEKGKPLLFAKPEEIEMLVPELSRRMVRRLGESTGSRTRLFDSGGALIGDSHQLIGPGGLVQIVSLDPPEDGVNLAVILRYLARKLLDVVPVQSDLQMYPYTTSHYVTEYPDASQALEGEVSATAWEDKSGAIILSAAAPVKKREQVMGVVMLNRNGHGIEMAMNQVRFGVLTAFLGSLSLTIFLSLYLAGIIGRPLKKLAVAAEAVRQGKGRQINIPDLSYRRDEIGELSLALRDMTQALWDRMDTIEAFAADVAHEIKNPLTSLRSAVETVDKVKGKKEREELMAIIHHDVRRMDRLISDISNASRLDAELSRDEMSVVDLRVLLEQLADFHRQPFQRGSVGGADESEESKLILEIPRRRDIRVRGNEGRLAQVFENLISNALSFSPEAAPVLVRVVPDKKNVKIMVEDEGPGIPENKLSSIFERFYTERPRHEHYGDHSGLGLSIARQIITAHDGQIFAENIHGGDGNIAGACFTVILDMVP